LYVNNVRQTIAEMQKDDYEDYLRRLRIVLNSKYNKNVKPSELRQRVTDFIEGRDPKIESFEAYLITFDELLKDGAMVALHNKKVKMPKSWRELLLTVTGDRALSPEVIKHLDEEEILIELKTLFYYSIEYCKSGNRDNFFDNLRVFNSFLKITFNEK
jgi:hypothetical protein